MDRLYYKEEIECLYRAGFRPEEIERLAKFRHGYRKSDLDQAAIDLHHLQFIRWLVEHGRLTEQVSN
jgi:hypothetical protein